MQKFDILFDFLDGKNIVFIGGGNMAKAIIRGLLDSKETHQLDLTLGVSEMDAPKRAYFEGLGVSSAEPKDAQKLLEKADVVVLAVKPQTMKSVAPSLKPYLAGKLVISIMAGISIDTLSGWLGTSRIIRTMPNLPASVGKGATGLYAQLGDTDKNIAQAMMASVGMTVWVNRENDLHTVTAVAGSAPAYFFYMLQAMIATAIEMGLDAKSAKDLAVASMMGAGSMAMGGDPAILQAQVTSKGGTTEKALATLDKHAVKPALKEAMIACANRSRELGRAFNDRLVIKTKGDTEGNGVL